MSTDPVPAEPTEEAPNAYSLLTKPTTELTSSEVEIIVADLRKRRDAYVSSGGKAADRPDKAKPKKPEGTRAELTRLAAASLNLDFDL